MQTVNNDTHIIRILGFIVRGFIQKVIHIKTPKTTRLMDNNVDNVDNSMWTDVDKWYE